MTVGPGDEWGRTVARPTRLQTAHDDAEVVRLLRGDSDVAVLVAGGDLARTLGTPPPEPRASLQELPVDLLEVTTEHGTVLACAHVVVRSSWSRGGWWHGPVIAVMNAQFIGDWDVAPRGHPNDGRAEILQAESLSWRDRLAVRRRLPHGTHLPHPGITVRSVRAAEWDLPRGSVVAIDGGASRRARSLAVRVIPDAAVVHH